MKKKVGNGLFKKDYVELLKNSSPIKVINDNNSKFEIYLMDEFKPLYEACIKQESLIYFVDLGERIVCFIEKGYYDVMEEYFCDDINKLILLSTKKINKIQKIKMITHISLMVACVIFFLLIYFLVLKNSSETTSKITIILIIVFCVFVYILTPYIFRIFLKKEGFNIQYKENEILGEEKYKLLMDNANLYRNNFFQSNNELFNKDDNIDDNNDDNSSEEDKIIEDDNKEDEADE